MRILTERMECGTFVPRPSVFQCLNGIHADSNRAVAPVSEVDSLALFQCLNGIHADSNRGRVRVRGACRAEFQCLNGIHADSNNPRERPIVHGG